MVIFTQIFWKTAIPFNVPCEVANDESNNFFHRELTNKDRIFYDFNEHVVGRRKNRYDLRAISSRENEMEQHSTEE